MKNRLKGDKNPQQQAKCLHQLIARILGYNEFNGIGSAATIFFCKQLISLHPELQLKVIIISGVKAQFMSDIF